MGLTKKKGPVLTVVTQNVTVHLSRELAEELLAALTHALDTGTVGKKTLGKKTLGKTVVGKTVFGKTVKTLGKS